MRVGAVVRLQPVTLDLPAMKSLLAFLIFVAQFVTPAFAAPMPAKDVAEINKVIDDSNAAFMRSDAVTIADDTSDRLMQAVGGRDKYVESIQAGMKSTQAQGIKVVSHTAETPTPPIKAGEFIIAVVKEVTVMTSHGRQLRNDGFTVVVRRAAGGPWKLIGGSGVAQNPGVIAMLYPGFPADYKFPPYTTTPL